MRVTREKKFISTAGPPMRFSISVAGLPPAKAWSGHSKNQVPKKSSSRRLPRREEMFISAASFISRATTVLPLPRKWKIGVASHSRYPLMHSPRGWALLSIFGKMRVPTSARVGLPPMPLTPLTNFQNFSPLSFFFFFPVRARI